MLASDGPFPTVPGASWLSRQTAAISAFALPPESLVMRPVALLGGGALTFVDPFTSKWKSDPTPSVERKSAPDGGVETGQPGLEPGIPGFGDRCLKGRRRTGKPNSAAKHFNGKAKGKSA